MFSSLWTTILGQLLGIFTGVIPMIQTGKIDWPHVGAYLTSSLLGAAAADVKSLWQPKG